MNAWFSAGIFVTLTVGDFVFAAIASWKANRFRDSNEEAEQARWETYLRFSVFAFIALLLPLAASLHYVIWPTN